MLITGHRLIDCNCWEKKKNVHHHICDYDEQLIIEMQLGL